MNLKQIDYDPAKVAANVTKHGVLLAFGARLFDDARYLVLSSARPVDGEFRAKVLGMVDGKLWTAIYVVRGDVIRFISVRRSNDGERCAYHRD